MFSYSLYLYIKYERMDAVDSYAIEYMTIMCLKINWDKYMKFCTVCLKIFIIHANMRALLSTPSNDFYHF